MKKVAVFILMLSISCVYSMSEFALKKVRGGYQFELILPQFSIDTIHVNDTFQNGCTIQKDFERIILPGYSANGVTGAPQLLSSSFNLAIESGEVEVQYTIDEMDTVLLTHTLYPKQHAVAVCAEGRRNYFSFNSDYYKDFENSSIVSVGGYFTFRKQKVATINVAPITYNYGKQELYIAKRISVSIVVREPQSVRSANSNLFDTILRTKCKNLQGEIGRSIPSEESRNKESYLIIVADRYYGNPDLQRLIAYRSKDYAVEVVKNSTLGLTIAHYRSFIRGKMPTFLLMVGDDSDFPTHRFKFNMGKIITVKSIAYAICANTTDEPSPDIAMGLFMVSNSGEIKNMVDKTIAAEAANDKMANIYVGVGGNKYPMGPLKADHCDYAIKEVWETFFEPNNYSFVSSYSMIEPIGNKNNIINANNQGARFINYNGHGMVTHWVYGWGNNDLGSLTNTEYFPYVLSCCCYTGTFDKDYCMARSFSTNAKGPAAFIGSYEQSTMGQHALNYGMYEAIMNKKITKYGLAFVYAANSKVVPKSCEALPPDVYATQLMQWQYHLYGDPALETITGVDSPIISNNNMSQKKTLSLITLSNEKIVLYSPVSGTFQMKVYDMRGREIRTTELSLIRGVTSLDFDLLQQANQIVTISIEGMGFKRQCKALLM